MNPTRGNGRPGKARRGRRATNELKKNGFLFFMLLPGIAVLLVNSYLPMAGIVMAFQKIDFSRFAFLGKWVGLKNLSVFFSSTYFPVILRNTLLYNLAFIVLGRIFELVLAISINELLGSFSKKFYQAVMFLPYFISWVAISYVVVVYFNHDYGFLNTRILPMLGLDPVRWYMTPEAWPYILILLNCWKGAGYGMVMFLASMANINPEYYEAARIDGAGKWQQILHITLPSLKPMIIILTLLSIGRIFNTDIGLFYTVPMRDVNGQLTSVTSTIDTFVYVNLKGGSAGTINIASAGAFLQSVVGFILVVTANLFVRKVDPDSALF